MKSDFYIMVGAIEAGGPQKNFAPYTWSSSTALCIARAYIIYSNQRRAFTVRSRMDLSDSWLKSSDTLATTLYTL